MNNYDRAAYKKNRLANLVVSPEKCEATKEIYCSHYEVLDEVLPKAIAKEEIDAETLSEASFCIDSAIITELSVYGPSIMTEAEIAALTEDYPEILDIIAEKKAEIGYEYIATPDGFVPAARKYKAILELELEDWLEAETDEDEQIFMMSKAKN